MVEQSRTNAGQGLGIAGLVLGILSIPLAIMGCTMFVALLFGGVGIVFSAISISQAKQSNGAKGLPTSGLVVSIIGTSIALLWFLFIGSFFKGAFQDKKWWKEIENLDEVAGEIEREMETDIEDKEKSMEKLEKKMEELEGEIKEGTTDTRESVDQAEDSLEKVEEKLDQLRKEKKE